ncbi:toprim domain-containing protein [Candidatus Dojkabacteria bacterium]|jgi:hypothetical protein|nr:toprim domain-containing protein [Candidatus Dojkabacteria bacterium]
MNYSIEEINNIIYNNRSYDNVTANFIPKLNNEDLKLLIEIDKQLAYINKLLNKNRYVEIDKKHLDLDKLDLKITPNDINNIKISSRNFNDEEKALLEKKQIPKNIIDEYDISPVSNIKDENILTIIGVSTHPILERFLGNDFKSGLLIPLYKDGKLINVICRKIYDLTRLKYGLAVPSIDLWGDENYENEDLWIVEGGFDMMAIRNEGFKCVTSSSCTLNDYQYFKIIKNKPKKIKIFSDNDSSGYRSALISKKLFGLNYIPCEIYHSKICKDAAEHFFEKELNWNDVEMINITSDMINNNDNLKFNFIEYLKTKKF